MKYILNQKLFAFGDDFMIENSKGKKTFAIVIDMICHHDCVENS